jgi:hypothetical protein
VTFTALYEWMQFKTLDLLVASRSFAAFSHRRKLGLVKSLSAALLKIHDMGLVHGHICPELVLLDKYHEVKLELSPFVNPYTMFTLTPKVQLYVEGDSPSK